jgi:hypothetical protein
VSRSSLFLIGIEDTTRSSVAREPVEVHPTGSELFAFDQAVGSPSSAVTFDTSNEDRLPGLYLKGFGGPRLLCKGCVDADEKKSEP